MNAEKSRVCCTLIQLVSGLALLSACAAPFQRGDEGGKAPAAASIIQPDLNKIRDSLVKILPRLRETHRIEGLSLILVRNQETLWAEGFGFADRKTRRPVTPDTVFRAGSLAKPITAMAVMQLEEAGKLDIDQPVIAYLPQFSIGSRFDTTGEPITLRSILYHHSGLPTDLGKGMWSHADFTEVVSKLDEEYTAFPPNLVFSYSNVGYTLLGHIVQEESGMAYSDYVREHLFQQIDMHSSSMGMSEALAPHLASGYRNGEKAELLPIRDQPAFALYTTANDLGRFMKMLLAGGHVGGQRVIMPETLEQMFEPQNRDIPLDLNVINGLGWFLEQNSIPGGGRVVRHGGTTLLYSSELIMLPEQGLGVALLANSSGSRKLVSKLAEEILKLMLDAGGDTGKMAFQLDDFSKPPVESVPASPGGSYATDLGLISIRPKDAKLCACIIEETFDLIPYPNGWFGVSRDAVDSLPPSYKMLGKLKFQSQVIDGVEVIVAQKGNKHIVLGEKIPPTVVPDVWLKRVGNYRLVNPDEKFPVTEPKVLMTNGQLSMSYKMPLLSNRTIQVPLRPISDTEAIILGLGRARGETLRAVTVEGQEGLRYSGFIGKKIDVR